MASLGSHNNPKYLSKYRVSKYRKQNSDRTDRRNI
jgi:hypothetical protein